eukprot:c19356_g1_i1.p1 GENE.c19356_g1_i1~~c19356_g1_i1.p1  ORF type:complete len:861 (+),score=203.37 c19356_g1_i1:41-2584(+)
MGRHQPLEEEASDEEFDSVSTENDFQSTILADETTPLSAVPTEVPPNPTGAKGKSKNAKKTKRHNWSVDVPARTEVASDYGGLFVINQDMLTWQNNYPPWCPVCHLDIDKDIELLPKRLLTWKALQFWKYHIAMTIVEVCSSLVEQQSQPTPATSRRLYFAVGLAVGLFFLQFIVFHSFLYKGFRIRSRRRLKTFFVICVLHFVAVWFYIYNCIQVLAYNVTPTKPGDGLPIPVTVVYPLYMRALALIFAFFSNWWLLFLLVNTLAWITITDVQEKQYMIDRMDFDKKRSQTFLGSLGITTGGVSNEPVVLSEEHLDTIAWEDNSKNNIGGEDGGDSKGGANKKSKKLKKGAKGEEGDAQFNGDRPEGGWTCSYNHHEGLLIPVRALVSPHFLNICAIHKPFGETIARIWNVWDLESVSQHGRVLFITDTNSEAELYFASEEIVIKVLQEMNFVWREWMSLGPATKKKSLPLCGSHSNEKSSEWHCLMPVRNPERKTLRSQQLDILEQNTAATTGAASSSRFWKRNKVDASTEQSGTNSVQLEEGARQQSGVEIRELFANWIPFDKSDWESLSRGISMEPYRSDDVLVEEGDEVQDLFTIFPAIGQANDHYDATRTHHNTGHAESHHRHKFQNLANISGNGQMPLRAEIRQVDAMSNVAGMEAVFQVSENDTVGVTQFLLQHVGMSPEMRQRLGLAHGTNAVGVVGVSQCAYVLNFPSHVYAMSFESLRCARLESHKMASKLFIWLIRILLTRHRINANLASEFAIRERMRYELLHRRPIVRLLDGTPLQSKGHKMSVYEAQEISQVFGVPYGEPILFHTHCNFGPPAKATLFGYKSQSGSNTKVRQ